MTALPLFCFDGQRPGASTIFSGGDGLYYHLLNARPNRRFAYFRCVRHDRQYRSCPGTAKGLFGLGVLIHLHPHSHDANVWYPEVIQLRRAVTRRVRAGDQSSFVDILQQEGTGLPLDVRRRLPLGRIESRLNQIRRDLRPPVPASLEVLGALLLRPQYRHLTQCCDNLDNMYAGTCGNMADGTLSLVFICNEMKAFMETRSTVLADGTQRRLFRKPKASQIFNLVGLRKFHVIPMLRAIMLRRTEDAYMELFAFIKRLVPRFRPDKIMCDFEDAQMNAWRRSFPRATVEGCLWHFAVAVFMQARTLGLTDLIKASEEVASIVRAAAALPLLPRGQIEDGLEDLGWEAYNLGWMPDLQTFFAYLEREWIPKVPVLSVYKSVSRTNNGSESGNRSYNKQVKGGSRPSCFNVLDAFVKLNDRALVDLAILDDAQNVGHGRKISSLRNDRAIKNLTAELDLEDINWLTFLHRASRRMQNVFNHIFP